VEHALGRHAARRRFAQTGRAQRFRVHAYHPERQSDLDTAARHRRTRAHRQTLFLLAYIDDEGYRRRILVQLKRGEGRHRLARAVFHGQRGELRQRYREGQEDLPSGPEQAHVVKELQRIQGYLGGVAMQLVRALREDA